MQTLRQQLAHAVVKSLADFYDQEPHITEKGAIQLVFDIYFLNLVCQDGVMSEKLRSLLERAKELIDPINWAAFEPHFLPNAERFCLKQTLILGVLTRPNREAFER